MHVPPEVFESYLQEISRRYTAETYSLLTHNCNNFSNEVAQFLVGTSIPDCILNLPNEVMNSPMGALITPMIQQLEATLRAGADPHAPQFAPSSLGPAVGPATTNAANPNGSANRTEPEEQHSKKEEAAKAFSRAVAPAGAQEDNGVPGDPLGSARSKLQEEISLLLLW
ncbi:hypothetical protein Cgig2_010972 [Carnegiea gigantea]|uniref:PPPDE domain-containing protein n=1 Tax=Carnegiea gigantea TaxID=171969 RepID=A0A9Q1JLQ3_9CARY|nr:hypothetical protein Cgig2_010972 [Carnegiea gigantea]